ncbi:MAG TPA: hypothetical protein VKU86_06185 [Acidimicrobiales bacterium]|nr:hypothetical protein [Acidimicrobiales bacterium]
MTMPSRTKPRRSLRPTTSGASEPWTGVPRGAHEWMSFPDPEEERTWLFDVTFLESNWTCIFGRGCEGVLTGPAPELVQGCCSYGAHLTGGKDARRVERVAATLTPEQWQFHDVAYPKGSTRPQVITKSKAGDLTTRLVKDACIFLNRPGFARGPGCALHQVAIERGVPHLELKPDVCWQLPLRRDDEVAEDGHVTSVIRQWDRRDWGEGGFEFHWWCTESPEAFVGSRPVHEELEPELVAMVGKKIFRRLRRYLDARRRQYTDASGSASPHLPNGSAASATPVRLPHPAVRRKATT